jgi:hypothetical protein
MLALRLPLHLVRAKSGLPALKHADLDVASSHPLPSTESNPTICTSQHDSQTSYCYREPAQMHFTRVAYLDLHLEADICSHWHAALHRLVEPLCGMLQSTKAQTSVQLLVDWSKRES